jgi:hypothetical protein
MLTDSQIEDLAKKMSIPIAGVYFKDELPKKLEPNKSYIINLQDSETDDGEQNEGTHWTFLQVNETPKGQIEPIYFDPYGQPPSEAIKKAVQDSFHHYLPYTKKDVQSMMNNACGFYCLAMGHFLNACPLRTCNFYQDVEEFLDIFDDLNTSVDWKKNEYLLKMFFQSEDPSKRKPIDVHSQSHNDYERILKEDSGGGIDLMKVPVEMKHI